MEGELLQILNVFETNKKSLVDQVYVDETIRHFVKVDPSVSFKPIYLDGKANYSSQSVLSKIKDYEAMFKKLGKTQVVYYIDSDDPNGTAEKSQLNKNIRAFCQEKGFHLVWFIKDIEEVYLKRSAHHGENKADLAGRFRNGQRIASLNRASISKPNPRRYESNILVVLVPLAGRESDIQ